MLVVGLLATGRDAMAQADPGLVVVAEGDLARVAFELPGYYTPYRLNYSAGGPATVWFDREATILAEAQPATYFA